MTNKRVYVTTDYREKQLQRALLQFSRPENANLVREALVLAGREDLIGNGEGCLVRHAFGQGRASEVKVDKKTGRVRPTGKQAGSRAAGGTRERKGGTGSTRQDKGRSTRADKFSMTGSKSSAKVPSSRTNSGTRGGKNTARGTASHKGGSTKIGKNTKSARKGR